MTQICFHLDISTKCVFVYPNVMLLSRFQHLLYLSRKPLYFLGINDTYNVEQADSLLFPVHCTPTALFWQCFLPFQILRLNSLFFSVLCIMMSYVVTNAASYISIRLGLNTFSLCFEICASKSRQIL